MRAERLLARPTPNPTARAGGALARFRSEYTHDSERLVSCAETSWRIHQAHHERAITVLPASPLACTRALEVMHDTATTASRRASSYRSRRPFGPIRNGRCVRLTSANPNCQRRVLARPPPTDGRRRVDLAEHRCAARFTPWQRASVCLWNDVERVVLSVEPCGSPLALRRRPCHAQRVDAARTTKAAIPAAS